MIEFKIDSERLAANIQHTAEAAANEVITNALEEVFQRGWRDEVISGMRERIKALTDDAIRDEIKRVLTDGWAETDSYGQPTARRLTLGALVLNYLTKGSDYTRPNEHLKRMVEEGVNTALKGELGQLLDGAKAKMREMLDETIQAKLRKAFAEVTGGK